MSSKLNDWFGAVGGTFSFITVVVLFIANLQNWISNTRMLHNFSIAIFILFILCTLWFFLKSSAPARWKWTSLVIVYIFSASYFAWVGTWFSSNEVNNALSQARIVEPQNGEIVDMYTPFLMEYSNIPEDGYLWVVIDVPKYNKVYLWANDELQNDLAKDGVMSSNVQVGATSSAGDVFNIIVLLVDEKVNFSFQEYDKQCKLLDQCNGIVLPDSGAIVLDFSTVTRK